MKWRLTFGILALAMAFLPGKLFAQEGPLAYTMSMTHNTSEDAWVEVTSNMNGVNDIEIIVRNCGMKNTAYNTGEMSLGESKRFSWRQPAGTYKCTLEFKATTEEGIMRASQDVQMVSRPGLRMDIDLNSFSAEHHTIKVITDRQADHFEISIYDENLMPVETLTQKAKGVENTLSWGKTNNPALVLIKVFDENGTWASRELLQYLIPHTDIEFDTNKFNIRKDQEPLLGETLSKLQEIFGRVEQITMELYIAGYTDTVGNSTDNMQLSEKRAKSIATWFRKHGVTIPVYYAGFGEQHLAVPTADEVAEQKNRRVLYLLSSSAPVGGEFDGAEWNKL